MRRGSAYPRTQRQNASAAEVRAPTFLMSRVDRPLQGAGATIAELRLAADALDALPGQPYEAMERPQAAD